eukprot:357924-Chlamydomonas_euryale.AAC.3
MSLHFVYFSCSICVVTSCYYTSLFVSRTQAGPAHFHVCPPLPASMSLRPYPLSVRLAYLLASACVRLTYSLQTAPPQGGVLRHPRPSWRLARPVTFCHHILSLGEVEQESLAQSLSIPHIRRGQGRASVHIGTPSRHCLARSVAFR